MIKLKKLIKEDISSFKGQIDKRYNIIVVSKEHPKYEEFKKFITSGKIAVTIPGKPIIFVDGEKFKNMNLSDNDIIFIEAHEIAHHLLKHKFTKDIDQEREADYGAYLLLRKHQFNIAANSVRNLFKKRQGVSFEEFEKTHGDKIKKRMKI